MVAACFKTVTEIDQAYKWSIEPLELEALMPILPRKEVIHPHLPVRIPCYDLTPIISPTLGPDKLARQVLATFMV